jgi:hypothetical protein
MEPVDALIPVLQAKLSELDPSVPVVLWCLDSACFRTLTADGDLKSASANLPLMVNTMSLGCH